MNSSFDEEARRAAHDVIDTLFDHIQSVAEKPVVDWTSGPGLRERFALAAEPDAPGISRLAALESIRAVAAEEKR